MSNSPNDKYDYYRNNMEKLVVSVFSVNVLNDVKRDHLVYGNFKQSKNLLKCLKS